MKKGFDYDHSTEFEVEIKGKKYTGRYALRSSILSITSAYGEKSTQIGGSTSLSLAKMLLTELVSTSE